MDYEASRYDSGFACKEIERKFEVKDGWRPNIIATHHITNCYFPKGAERKVRFALSPDKKTFSIVKNEDETTLLKVPLCEELQNNLKSRICKKIFPEDESQASKNQARIRFWQEVDGQEKAFLTIKAKSRENHIRHEFEMPLPLDVAHELVAYAPHRIEKLRHIIPYAEHRWEIDELLGPYMGNFIAEIELPTRNAPFSIPPWVGKELHGVSNSGLARRSRLIPIVSDSRNHAGTIHPTFLERETRRRKSPIQSVLTA